MAQDRLTAGVHHVGLAVRDLEASAGFFKRLGWDEVRRVPDYPAVFVSDGTIMLTLWQLDLDETPTPFDRRRNVGLHHLALQVRSEAALNEIHEKLAAADDVTIEFAPEPLRRGPAKHMMCYEPGGIRVEFIWPGR